MVPLPTCEAVGVAGSSLALFLAGTAHPKRSHTFPSRAHRRTDAQLLWCYCTCRCVGVNLPCRWDCSRKAARGSDETRKLRQRNAHVSARATHPTPTRALQQHTCHTAPHVSAERDHDNSANTATSLHAASAEASQPHASSTSGAQGGAKLAVHRDSSIICDADSDDLPHGIAALVRESDSDGRGNSTDQVRTPSCLPGLVSVFCCAAVPCSTKQLPTPTPHHASPHLTG